MDELEHRRACREAKTQITAAAAPPREPGVLCYLAAESYVCRQPDNLGHGETAQAAHGVIGRPN